MLFDGFYTMVCSDTKQKCKCVDAHMIPFVHEITLLVGSYLPQVTAVLWS